MKNVRKIISLLLCLSLCASAASLFAFGADAGESVTVKFLNYNVSGLPDVNYLLRKDGGKDISLNQSLLGSQLDESDFDVIAVQEDFGYHNLLVANMDSYKYKTPHYGSIPGGDGLNIFTRTAPIYDMKRTAWTKAGGPISDGDMLTAKGILYTVLDLGDGIYLDFYNIHSDAFDDPDSAAARASQYKQLMDLVEKNSAGRPVIITGDFNTTLALMHWENNEDEYALREQFYVRGGFKDAWNELVGDGNYVDPPASNYVWGESDSVEKYLYKDGGGVSISASGFEYLRFFNDKGESISDHAAAVCSFTFTKTADFAPDTRSHSVKSITGMTILMNTLKWVLKDLATVFRNWGEVKEWLGL